MLGLCRDNGKENGNYYLGFRVENLGCKGEGLGQACRLTDSNMLCRGTSPGRL